MMSRIFKKKVGIGAIYKLWYERFALDVSDLPSCVPAEQLNNEAFVKKLVTYRLAFLIEAVRLASEKNASYAKAHAAYVEEASRTDSSVSSGSRLDDVHLVLNFVHQFRDGGNPFGAQFIADWEEDTGFDLGWNPVAAMTFGAYLMDDYISISETILYLAKRTRVT